ncbi:MAG: sulfotransferase domain-containing protein [Sedimenticolaceae bacterium]
MPILSDRGKRRAILQSTALFPRRLRLWTRYRLLANLEVGKARRGSSIIIGHPKSGNTWLRTMIARAYQIKYDLPPTVALKTDELARLDSRVPRFCVANGFYTYERALHELLVGDRLDPEVADKPVVLLLRHPADIAVSWYIQFTKRVSPSKRELINASLEHPIDVERISRWDFVMHSEIGLSCIIDFLNDWERTLEDLNHTLTVRYEDLRSTPYETLKKITDFIGQPFDDEVLREAVEFGSFENLRKLEASGFFKYGGMARRKHAGPETMKVRRGKAGGYREDFSPEQLREIDRLVSSRLSPTLGYGAAGESDAMITADLDSQRAAAGAPAKGPAA